MLMRDSSCSGQSARVSGSLWSFFQAQRCQYPKRAFGKAAGGRKRATGGPRAMGGSCLLYVCSTNKCPKVHQAVSCCVTSGMQYCERGNVIKQPAAIVGRSLSPRSPLAPVLGPGAKSSTASFWSVAGRWRCRWLVGWLAGRWRKCPSAPNKATP